MFERVTQVAAKIVNHEIAPDDIGNGNVNDKTQSTKSYISIFTIQIVVNRLHFKLFIEH